MANVTLELDADTVKYIAKINRAAKADRKLTDGYRKGGRQLKKQDNLLGAIASRFGPMATAAGAVTAAITAGVAAMRHLREEQQRALQVGQEAELSMGQLAQVAIRNGAVDPDLLRKFQGQAKLMSQTTGMDLGTAARTIFNLESAGINEIENRRLIGELSNVTGGDASEVAGGAGRIQAAFGRREAGTIREVLNKMFGASAISQSTVQEFAPAATLAANLQKTIGGSDEELLGLMAIMSRELKSVDIAGTRLGALADVIGTKGYGGEGMFAGVARIREDLQGATAEEMKTYFGRKEARLAYYSLADAEKVPTFVDAIASVSAAGETTDEGGADLVGSMVRANKAANPYLIARIAKQRRKIAEEYHHGESQAFREAGEDTMAVDDLNRGRGWGTRWGLGAMRWADKVIGDVYGYEPGTERIGRVMNERVRDEAREFNADLSERSEEARERAARTLERIESLMTTGSRLDMDQ